MTETDDLESRKNLQNVRKRRCRIVAVVVFVVLITILVIALILAFTVFKVKDPKTELVSATVDGIAPRVSFPAVRIELNVTIDLEILVDNPNHASFKHGPGKSYVFYRGNQVGEVDLSPGNIPSSGSEILQCRLTLEADEFASELSNLISDVMAGELVIDTRTRIPGRVTFLGIFKKHAVAVSQCEVAIGVSDLKIRRQECRNKTKL